MRGSGNSTTPLTWVLYPPFTYTESHLPSSRTTRYEYKYFDSVESRLTASTIDGGTNYRWCVPPFRSNYPTISISTSHLSKNILLDETRQNFLFPWGSSILYILIFFIFVWKSLEIATIFVIWYGFFFFFFSYLFFISFVWKSVNFATY